MGERGRQFITWSQDRSAVHHARASVSGELKLFSQRQQDTENRNKEAEVPDTNPLTGGSVISEGTVVVGDLISPDDVRVDGTVQGEVRGLHVWIGVDAAVEGALVAERVTIEGRISGPIFADYIHLGASSRVQGDLCSDNITISKGALLVGRVWPSQPPSRMDVRPRIQPAAFPPLNSPSLSDLKKLEPVAIEKPPPSDPGEQKD
jgi:cytoskeletal protein CcmA (bactofilin family)